MRGGKREGAGRKRNGSLLYKRIVTEAEKEKLDELLNGLRYENKRTT